MNKSTWSDGTPRSTGNAFCVPAIGAKTPAQHLADAANTKKRNYDRYTAKLLARGTSREEIARNKATRINPEASVAAFIPNSKKAPR